MIEDAHGTAATIVATHRAECPAALDVLAAALSRGPRFVAGPVRRAGGGLLIDPTALVVADKVICPALTTADQQPSMVLAGAPTPDPIHAGFALLAEAAHRGLLHLPPTFPARIRAAADDLTAHGYPRAGTAVAAALTNPDAWADAAIRLLVLRERQ